MVQPVRSTVPPAPLPTVTRSPGQSRAVTAVELPVTGGGAGAVVVVVVAMGTGVGGVAALPMQVSRALRRALTSAWSALRSQRTLTATQSVAYWHQSSWRGGSHWAGSSSLLVRLLEAETAMREPP